LKLFIWGERNFYLKNCLAIIGLVFVLIVSVLGIIIFTGIYDLEGLLVQGTPFVQGTPLFELPTPTTAITTAIPVPTLTLIPEPTQVPDPVEYRTRVVLRAKHFATALEAFWDVNDRVQQDPALFEDPEWRSEVRATLDEFVEASELLSGIRPVLVEYQPIGEQLDQIGALAAELEGNYLLGLETGDERYFEAVDNNLNQIVERLTQAQVLMIAAGWEP
jgi:hypothetical protein